MNRSRIVTIAATALFGLAIVQAGEGLKPTPPPSSHELDAIKKLQGHWEGVSTEMQKPGEAPQKVTVDYRVTSGGSAVVETLFGGTPHEMVSVYHDENGKLTMTHYCAMGNQPHMSLQKASDSEISLAVGANGGVKPDEAHMHALTLAMAGPNDLKQTWTSYNGGKPQGTSVFSFKRVSAAP